MGILTNDGCGRGGHERNFSCEWVVTKIGSQLDVVMQKFLKKILGIPG